MSDKTCPMQIPDGRAYFMHCKEGDCAWWVEESQCCVVLPIGRAAAQLVKSDTDAEEFPGTGGYLPEPE